MQITYKLVDRQNIDDEATLLGDGREIYHLSNGTDGYVVVVWHLSEMLEFAHDEQHKQAIKKYFLQKIFDDCYLDDATEGAIDASFFGMAEKVLFTTTY